MIAKNQLQFENIRALENRLKPGCLIIIAREKGKTNDLIIADYSRETGLEPQYDLKSVLTKTQQQKVGKLIDEFHPEGGYHYGKD